jgi:hypothetical protein
MQNAKLATDMSALKEGSDDNGCRLAACKVQIAALRDARARDRAEAQIALSSALNDVAAANARAAQFEAAAHAARKLQEAALDHATRKESMLLATSQDLEVHRKRLHNLSQELCDVQKAAEVWTRFNCFHLLWVQLACANAFAVCRVHHIVWQNSSACAGVCDCCTAAPHFY